MFKRSRRDRAMTAKHETREAWLNDVAGKLAPLFKEHGAPLPKRIRIAVSFPSTGAKGKRIGECWDKTASRDGTFEIMIRPDVDDAAEEAAILAHELCHAAVGIPAGHGPKFRKLALAIGLEGKMKSTVAGEAFKAFVAPILKAAGPLPHARLDLAGLTTKPKKQSTRMIKCECLTCNYVVRTAKKWIMDAGAPICPTKGHGPMVADMPEDDDDTEEGED